MSNFSHPAGRWGRRTTFSFRGWVTRLSGLGLAVFARGFAARMGDEPEDAYLRVYNLIQQADELNRNSQPAPALAKYKQAQTALKALQTDSPDWNPPMVTFRADYVAKKIAVLTAPAVAPAPAPTPGQRPRRLRRPIRPPASACRSS